MRVALDLEDVLVYNVKNFIEELNDFVSRRHSIERDFKLADVQGWRFKGIRGEVAELPGWDSEYTEKFMHGDGDGWQGFLPITERIWREERHRYRPREENVREKVERIRQISGVEELSIVTARENVDRELRKRVRELGIAETVDDTIIEREKQKLGFDIYIDDHPRLHSKLENATQIVVNQPWNRDISGNHPRLEKLSEAERVIRDLE